MEIVLSKLAQKFIAKLDKKFARQIVLKIEDLTLTGHCHDTHKLKCAGALYHYRVDVGEFRIIYKHEKQRLIIELIGKRNDDEIYNLFKRMPK